MLHGGAESLDEFLKVPTWRQLDLHAIFPLLLNTDGYCNPKLSLIGHVVAEGFAEPDVQVRISMVSHERLLRVALAPGSVLDDAASDPKG